MYMISSSRLWNLSAGDIAFRFIDFLRNLKSSSNMESDRGHVTVCDINQAMLDVGKNKAVTYGHSESLSFCAHLAV